MDGVVSGPLSGVRVIELGGIGPAPFTGMVLANLGAEVTVVIRPGRVLHSVLDRDKRPLHADLKSPNDVAHVKTLVAESDVIVEGFRPGVAERLGFSPEEVAQWNPRIVYGRITGFGRSGPLADRAGHDINYIAMSGVLGAMGPAGQAPAPPLNLVADFGGGGLVLALGVVAALLRSRETGCGEVVDTSMIDGSAMLMSMIYGFHAVGRWGDHRGDNLLDGGAPFYRTYECADGGYIAVGAIEPPFFANLIASLELDDAVDVRRQQDRTYWPELTAVLSEAFARRPRNEWAEILTQIDTCATPVLGLGEVGAHPHNAHRGTFQSIEGGVAPASAPHFHPLHSAASAILEGTTR